MKLKKAKRVLKEWSKDIKIHPLHRIEIAIGIVLKELKKPNRLGKKQIEAVYKYLINIEQPTTAKQFKKDWSEKKIKEDIKDAWRKANPKLYELATMDECIPDLKQRMGLKQNLRDLTEPKVYHEKIKDIIDPIITPTYHEEDQPGKENTISKPIDMDKINKIFKNLSE